MKTPGPKLYAYDDHRQYLADWFDWKRHTKAFSYRAFAKKAGFGSHSILPLITAGKRNLSIKGIAKFAHALQLSPEQRTYFEALVLLNQTRDPADRLRYYEIIVNHRGRRQVTPLAKAQLAFFQHWLGPVVFEMVQFPDFRPDPAWVVERLDKQCTLTEAKQILQSLIDAQLVVRQPGGAWRHKDQHIESGENIRDIHLLAYHEQALGKAADALWSVPYDQRQFHVLTLAVPQSALADLRALAEKFEEEVARLADRAPGDKDQVVQVSLQVFAVLPPHGETQT